MKWVVTFTKKSIPPITVDAATEGEAVGQVVRMNIGTIASINPGTVDTPTTTGPELHAPVLRFVSLVAGALCVFVGLLALVVLTAEGFLLLLIGLFLIGASVSQH